MGVACAWPRIKKAAVFGQPYYHVCFLLFGERKHPLAFYLRCARRLKSVAGEVKADLQLRIGYGVCHR